MLQSSLRLIIASLTTALRLLSTSVIKIGILPCEKGGNSMDAFTTRNEGDCFFRLQLQGLLGLPTTVHRWVTVRIEDYESEAMYLK